MYIHWREIDMFIKDFIQPMGLTSIEENSFLALDKKLNKTNINDQDEEGNTLLHHAAARACETMVVFLLEKGGFTNIRNKKGLNAYQMIPENQPKFRVLFLT